MSKPLKITLFFDVISPYTYFCWETLMSYKKTWNLDLELRPMFLGGIMQATGNRPPAMLPARGMFMAGDTARNAFLYGIPYLPSPANFISEAALKVLTVQRLLVGRQRDGASQEEMERIITAFFKAFHGDPTYRSEENNLIINDSAIVRILTATGMPESVAHRALQRSKDADVKQALQDNTKSAVDAGVYGSPTMLIHGGKAPFYDGENPWLVFGSDRFEQIAYVCGLPYHGVVNRQSKL